MTALDQRLGVLGGVAVRQDDALNPGIQERQDAGRVGVRDAGQRADADRLGGPGQLAGALDVDAGVLAVHHHVVEAGRPQELDQLGRVRDLLEHRPDHRLTVGDLLAKGIEEHWSLRRSFWPLR